MARGESGKKVARAARAGAQAEAAKEGRSGIR